MFGVKKRYTRKFEKAFKSIDARIKTVPVKCES